MTNYQLLITMTPTTLNHIQPIVTADNVTLLTEDDIYLFNEGSHFHLYEK